MRPKVNSTMTMTTNTQRFDTEHHYTVQLLQLKLRLATKIVATTAIWGSSATNVDNKNTYNDTYKGTYKINATTNT